MVGLLCTVVLGIDSLTSCFPFRTMPLQSFRDFSKNQEVGQRWDFKHCIGFRANLVHFRSVLGWRSRREDVRCCRGPLGWHPGRMSGSWNPSLRRHLLSLHHPRLLQLQLRIRFRLRSPCNSNPHAIPRKPLSHDAQASRKRPPTT